MQSFLIAGLVAAVLINLAAAPLRRRVTLIRSPQQLVLQPQQAAARLDAVILAVCLVWLTYALMTRSTVGLAIGGVAAASVAWRLLVARRAPVFTFDRVQDQVRRGAHPVCDLHRIDALEIVDGGRMAELRLRFRDRRGAPRHARLHADSPPRVAALQEAITDFLAV